MRRIVTRPILFFADAWIRISKYVILMLIDIAT